MTRTASTSGYELGLLAAAGSLTIIPGAFVIYFVCTFSWIGLGLYLVPGYPWKIMIFYGVIYTPLISYATAKLEGLVGRAVNVPYLRDLTILLSGYRGVAIWFAPMPIQNLEQTARRIALVRHTQLVDFVEQEDRVSRSGLLHSLEDPTGHGADVGSAVAADIGLVTRPAERDANILATHRPSY